MRPALCAALRTSSRGALLPLCLLSSAIASPTPRAPKATRSLYVVTAQLRRVSSLARATGDFLAQLRTHAAVQSSPDTRATALDRRTGVSAAVAWTVLIDSVAARNDRVALATLFGSKKFARRIPEDNLGERACSALLSAMLAARPHPTSNQLCRVLRDLTDRGGIVTEDHRRIVADGCLRVGIRVPDTYSGRHSGGRASASYVLKYIAEERRTRSLDDVLPLMKACVGDVGPRFITVLMARDIYEPRDVERIVQETGIQPNMIVWSHAISNALRMSGPAAAIEGFLYAWGPRKTPVQHSTTKAVILALLTTAGTSHYRCEPKRIQQALGIFWQQVRKPVEADDSWLSGYAPLVPVLASHLAFEHRWSTIRLILSAFEARNFALDPDPTFAQVRVAIYRTSSHSDALSLVVQHKYLSVEALKRMLGMIAQIRFDKAPLMPLSDLIVFLQHLEAMHGIHDLSAVMSYLHALVENLEILVLESKRIALTTSQDEQRRHAVATLHSVLVEALVAAKYPALVDKPFYTALLECYRAARSDEWRRCWEWLSAQRVPLAVDEVALRQQRSFRHQDSCTCSGNLGTVSRYGCTPDVSAWTGWAVLLCKKGELDEALSVIVEHIRDDPDNRVGRRAAVALFTLANPEGLERYERALPRTWADKRTHEDLAWWRTRRSQLSLEKLDGRTKGCPSRD